MERAQAVAHLRTLELSAGATTAEVKAAYRELAKRWHPDLCLDDPVRLPLAEERIKEINAAYSWLRRYPDVLDEMIADQTADRSRSRARRRRRRAPRVAVWGGAITAACALTAAAAMILAGSAAHWWPASATPAPPLHREQVDGGGGRLAEPGVDLAGLTDFERLSIRRACDTDQLLYGRGRYAHCVRTQARLLAEMPRPDLSGLTPEHAQEIMNACAAEALFDGPAVQYACARRRARRAP